MDHSFVCSPELVALEVSGGWRLTVRGGGAFLVCAWLSPVLCATGSYGWALVPAAGGVAALWLGRTLVPSTVVTLSAAGLSGRCGQNVLFDVETEDVMGFEHTFRVPGTDETPDTPGFIEAMASPREAPPQLGFGLVDRRPRLPLFGRGLHDDDLATICAACNAWLEQHRRAAPPHRT